ncbi:TetR/AcrR family transcriptional regulator [Georgenia yuyongxinii]|nr:TetR family transcriptional regulator [Georgenia yuyongxinii]
MPRPRLREAQKQMTRRLLLEQALGIFEVKGYAATTIDDIAAAAGTTRTTFYMHFSSKAQLMQELVAVLDEIFTSADDPPLRQVVSSGDRRLVRAFIETKADQWPATRSYVIAANQASAVEPDIAATREQWYEATISEMQHGLDDAGRFEPETRLVRCSLAFGELEWLSVRWMQRGWNLVDRETALGILTDSWCHLLTDDGARN